jgi:mitotic-spindle organizing protein 1
MHKANTQQASAALNIVHEISSLLDTGLDKESLSILIGLVESGVNPEALAAVVKELRREASALKAATQQQAAAGGAGRS